MPRFLLHLSRFSSKYSTPLSVASLTITVLYALYRLVLEKTDLALLQRGEVFAILDKIVFYLFVLSLVALILGIGGLAATRIIHPRTRTRPRRPLQGHSNDPYEYLKWEGIWDIKDSTGERVEYTKNLTVGFLQPNVNVITDRVWGDGETMQNYRCSLGIPSDVFEFGNSRKILISLRENKKTGSKEHFSISRTILHGFTRDQEWIEEEPGYYVKSFVLRIIFPKGRPCRRAVLTRRRANITEELGTESLGLTADGRQELLIFLQELYRERILLRWWW